MLKTGYGTIYMPGSEKRIPGVIFSVAGRSSLDESVLCQGVIFALHLRRTIDADMAKIVADFGGNPSMKKMVLPELKPGSHAIGWDTSAYSALVAVNHQQESKPCPQMKPEFCCQGQVL